MTAGKPLLLVVDDEAQMRRFLRASLESHGYSVLEAATALEATQLATSHKPELILLDLGLPDGDGIELTRKFRDWTKVPIIVISARGQEDDKVAALDAGADDYLTKPFGIKELMARIRAARRHVQEAANAPTVFELQGLRVDFERREVTREGQPVHLTPIEYKLLTLFVRNIGKVLTHRQILKEVWGDGYAAQTHYVRVHMAELRKKIELDPAQPRFIVTEPGVGYRLHEQPTVKAE
jgi:two-component system KDP operon response regulator KdpE